MTACYSVDYPDADDPNHPCYINYNDPNIPYIFATDGTDYTSQDNWVRIDLGGYKKTWRIYISKSSKLSTPPYNCDFKIRIGDTDDYANTANTECFSTSVPDFEELGSFWIDCSPSVGGQYIFIVGENTLV